MGWNTRRGEGVVEAVPWGMLMGKRRENWWREGKCDFCGSEDGGVGHFVHRCEDREVRGLREKVLGEMGENVQQEERQDWEAMSQKERLLSSMGKASGSLREKGALIWRKHWEAGGWEERIRVMARPDL